MLKENICFNFKFDNLVIVCKHLKTISPAKNKMFQGWELGWKEIRFLYNIVLKS